MQASGKSNLHGFTRGKDKQEYKGKDPMQEVYDEKIKELNEKMESMEATYTNQLKNMQNRVVTMERSNSNQKNFQPKGIWLPKKAPYKDNNLPNKLYKTNVVQEVIPYCIPCDSLHEEASCYVACQILEQGIPESGSSEEISSEIEYINAVGHMYPVSK